MDDFMTRVIAEKDDLKDKLIKLRMFLTTDKFRLLPIMDQRLLHQQEAHMAGYLEVLGERIKLFC